MKNGLGLALVLISLIVLSATAWGEDLTVSKTLSIKLAEAQGTNPAVVVELIGVPAGEFMMGTPPGAPRANKGEFYHKVRISRPFYLGKYEITQKQWWTFWGKPIPAASEQLPATVISWMDAKGFMADLNARFGKQLPKGMVFRLPTDAEWEYAARAGTTTPYYFGDDPTQLVDYAWCRANATNEMPVGLKKPNPWGFHDITGNVWELCLDYFCPDKTTTNEVSIDPINLTPDQPVAATVRGGSFHGQDGPESLRTAAQWGNIWPDKHRLNVGFRLAVGYPVNMEKP
jgi:formylglycine-generating enzyme required for sulfatase activity